MSTLQGAPYRRTIHTWTCPKGHTITLDDGGWPQQRGLKESILRAFQKEKCSCGSALTYGKTEQDAVQPTPRVPAVGPVADLTRFGREHNALPMTPGGAVAERAKAWAKKR